jgi:hypothetical protein
MTALDVLMDQIAALPGERAADAMKIVLDGINESPLDYDRRCVLLAHVVERLNEACRRRDLLDEREGQTLQ